jgi:hypothetical protein
MLAKKERMHQNRSRTKLVLMRESCNWLDTFYYWFWRSFLFSNVLECKFSFLSQSCSVYVSIKLILVSWFKNEHCSCQLKIPQEIIHSAIRNCHENLISRLPSNIIFPHSDSTNCLTYGLLYSVWNFSNHVYISYCMHSSIVQNLKFLESNWNTCISFETFGVKLIENGNLRFVTECIDS